MARQLAADNPPIAIERPTTAGRTHVVLRPMSLADVDQVALLDTVAFPNPWPARTYEYEIKDNDKARMFVLEPANLPPNPPHNGFHRSWWERLMGINSHDNWRDLVRICGYSGMWHIGDEAHISTIAVHPDWRGLKLGELLVWTMVRQAIWQGAKIMTLEVRVGNSVAQSLYKKYGFQVMGLRKGYYRDNHEDAFQMGIHKLDSDYSQKLSVHGKQLIRTLKVTDLWSSLYR